MKIIINKLTPFKFIIKLSLTLSLFLFSTFYHSAIADEKTADEKIFSAEVLAQAKQLRDVALEDNTGYQITESLTTEVGQRMAGSKANDLAVKWAQKKLKSLGFDRVTLEPVSYPTWIRTSESASIISPFPQKMMLTALGFSVGTSKRGVQAKVIQFNHLSDLELITDNRVKGKIVFISERMQRFRDGHGYGKTVRGRTAGASIAASKGAVGLLIRSVGTDNNRTPHTGVMHYQEGIKKIPAAALSNPDADLLLRELKKSKNVVVNMNLQVRMGPNKKSYNVVADMLGSSKPDEIVAIGGHLDSWDLATGAIDDGAGVGITTAAAYLIGHLAKRPARTIRVVLFANEETGLWGGKAYANRHFKEINKHIIAGESDFGAGPIYQLDAAVKPAAWPAIEAMAKVLKPIGIKLGEKKAEGGPDYSPFHAKGLAVFDLKQDGTKYFDWHHTSNDTFDKIDPKEMAQNVAAYAVVVYLSAQYDGDFGSPLPLTKKP